MSVVIETTIGDLTIDLFIQERPIACLNFLKLCKLKYYNYNLFHTVERGFIAQTGDPSGKGDGGSSVWGLFEGPLKRFFQSEDLPKIPHSRSGLVSLAGKNLVGSQFFFTLGDNLSSLNGNHTVIGEIVEGEETLRKLNEAIVDKHFRPFQDIRITHTIILDDPFPDPPGFQAPERSPSPSAERFLNGRIPADEEIHDTEGKTIEEIQELLAEREAKARATILEIVGDIPDADVAPPENVLFICQLNPVTTDDDLEIICSRFGKVKSCEVIRDKKTGDSLQYAFVEFEEQKSCETAYFKLDNVLIDDRRIHVDFSQSVAKVKWHGRGRGVTISQDRLDFQKFRDQRRNQKHQSGVPEKRSKYISSKDKRKEVQKRHGDHKNRHEDDEKRRRDHKNRHEDDEKRHRDHKDRHGDDEKRRRDHKNRHEDDEKRHRDHKNRHGDDKKRDGDHKSRYRDVEKRHREEKYYKNNKRARS